MAGLHSSVGATMLCVDSFSTESRDSSDDIGTIVGGRTRLVEDLKVVDLESVRRSGREAVDGRTDVRIGEGRLSDMKVGTITWSQL